MATANGKHHTGDGAIPPGEAWSRAEVMHRLDWGETAWRVARKKGLRILVSGNQRFVMTSDLISYIDRTGVEEK